MSTDHVHIGKNLFWPILLNLAITIAQFVGGMLSGSLSLLSDALHNFSDVISLVVSFIANRLVKQKNNLNRTFGLQRAEIIAAFINGCTLIVIAVFLIIESVDRFFHVEAIDPVYVIVLSIGSIFVNGISVLFLVKDKEHNLNIRSAYLHLFTDLLTSIAVLVGGICIYFFNIYWIDAVLSIGIAIYLTLISIKLLKESLQVLMLFVPNDISIEKINNRLKQIPEINNVHHVHLWQLNDYEIHFEAHIDFNKDIQLSEFGGLISEIHTIMKNDFGVNHCVLQPEYNYDDNKELIVQDY